MSTEAADEKAFIVQLCRESAERDAHLSHATLTFDMAPIPLYLKVAYRANPHSELDGVIVCMDLFANVAHTMPLALGLLMSAFPTDTQHEIEEELFQHLKSLAQRRRNAEALSNLVWNIGTAGLVR